MASSLKTGIQKDGVDSLQSGKDCTVFMAITKCLGRLQDLEKVEENLSVAVNWGYWRLGMAYQAFSDVSFACRRCSSALLIVP